MVAHPVRRQHRLKNYDYSTPNAYFLTICTAGHRSLFWRKDQKAALSPYGIIAAQAIQEIPQHYPHITVDTYAVMPNHVHLLLQIHAEGQNCVSISRVIQQFKGAVSKRIGFCVWQKLFHDHVIRSERDYQQIWLYIQSNPDNWEKDCFYSK